MTDASRRDLAEIVEKLCWNEATPADLARLDALLAAHPELWPAYQDAIHLHVCLRQRFGGPPTDAAPSRPRRRARWAASALAALAVGVLVALFIMPPPGVRAAPPATVTALQGELADGDGADADGRVRLVAGLAEVTFRCGAVVLLEGPAELTAETPDRGVLVAGRAAVRVPASTGRFAVDTPAARVSDGAADAEFGLDVAADGATVVQVYGGSVDAGGRAIAAGDAVRFVTPAAGTAVPFDPARFVRELPPLEARPGPEGDKKLPYNLPAHTGQRIPWAASVPVVDGELAEWDREFAVAGRCEPPFDAYRATLFAAYDDDALYLAAEVADPHPMRNRSAADAPRSEVWAGGSVVVRLSTDPALGSPPDARKPDNRVPRTAANTSDRLAHLVLWHSRPAGRACLDVAFGMDEHGSRRDPPGAVGAYRRWADGRGYTLEYAVPWTALAGPDARPRPGDATGICWQVHWADEGGRVWRGQLIEALTPGEVGLVFHNARRWGRADWLPRISR